MQIRAEASWRRVLTVCISLVALAGAALPGEAHSRRPRRIELPNGFQPEGIETRGKAGFFVGSIPTGAIYKGNLKTGEGSVFIEPPEGRNAIGLALRQGVLFVAGGPTGDGYAYDASTGDEVAAFNFTDGNAFVNDAVATEDAVYFTDSMNPVFYKVSIEGRSGFGDPQSIGYSGDLVYQEGFNANGIEATPNGQNLIVVQSNTGKLFNVDPTTGESSEIDLGDQTVPNGDGILLDGRDVLWVLQNRDNTLTKIVLQPNLSSGEVVSRKVIRGTDVPTTLARSRSYLALVNARFGHESPETTDYWVTQIRRPLS
ncbi:MAG TPA: superoxide dismutase [Actinomycetota bacterium]|nr:superoxide dismutase [Actinomycetota bacterium]